ncbi:MAG: hypothetical protein L0I79_01485, partial [Atopostipes sp.]|nr:hypothetical protein [Atopostipes sp.]
IKNAIHQRMYEEVRIPDSSTIDLNKKTIKDEGSEQQKLNYQENKTSTFHTRDTSFVQEKSRDPVDYYLNEFAHSKGNQSNDDLSPIELAQKAEKKNFNEEDQRTFPELEYIGQMHGTYLLTQNEEGLFIIDQHAAQERIKYEYYKKELGDTSDDMQELLVPIVLEYPSDEVMIISDNLDKLAAAGLNLESFGHNSFIIRNHPTWILAGQEQSTIEEMIDFFLDKKDLSISLFREATAIMMSCKRSIKANHYLNEKEAVSLVTELSEAENPYNCPHGRPTLIKIDNRELEKRFKRIQDNH